MTSGIDRSLGVDVGGVGEKARSGREVRFGLLHSAG